jgi:hypothetical protein
MKTYPRNPDAALAGMSNLTLKQRGAYNSLIDLLYSRDGLVLADDDSRNARSMAMDTREWRNSKWQLMRLGKVYIVDGMLRVPGFDDTANAVATHSATQAARAQLRWDLFKKAYDFNDPVMPSKSKSKGDREDTSELGPGLEKRTKLNGHNLTSKPRHGQGSKKGRIWFDRGTMEFDAHAADYRNHHYGLDPPLDWNNTGAWFNIKGET